MRLPAPATAVSPGLAGMSPPTGPCTGQSPETETGKPGVTGTGPPLWESEATAFGERRVSPAMSLSHPPEHPQARIWNWTVGTGASSDMVAEERAGFLGFAKYHEMCGLKQ